MKLETLVLGSLQTNCYILLEESTGEAAIIDPADQAEQILETVKQMGCTVKYIIITHAHIDHIAALDAVAIKTGAPVVIHAADQYTLNNDALNLALYFGLPAPTVKASIIVHDGDSLPLGSQTLQILHTPGHNKGSMCILCGDILIAGDTLFFESIGRVDHYGGNMQDILQSLDKLLQLPDNTKVYPGHGPATTIGHERTHNPYVR